MKSEIFYFKGDRAKPLVIFIHGMGMDAAMWAEPELARVLGGKYPLSILLGGAEMKTPFHDLKDQGYPVLTWSQTRPAGPALIAVEELKELALAYAAKAPAGMVLIGHSRGGLIARRFLQECVAPIRGVITIATPHKGSSMAKWVVYLSPLLAAVQKIMDLGDKEVRTSLHRVITFLSGHAIREMLPGSAFLTSLAERRQPGFFIASIGGTDPALVRIGSTPLPDLLAAVLPERMIPDELKEGKADGFVTAESAIYPGGDEHKDFHVHHAGLVFDRGIREYVMTSVLSLTD
jgi:pimeloyl-ACP methyl ester carboxylesterase